MPFSILCFEDYLEKANRCHTPEELFAVYLKAIKRHGIDRAIFGLLTDHHDLGEKAGTEIVSNFPQDWMESYFKQGFEKIDPIAQYALTQTEAFTWEEVEKKINLSKEQKKMLALVAEAGLHNGIGVSFRGTGTQIAAMGLATTEKVDSFDGAIDLITAYSNHFYFRYRAMKKGNDYLQVSLTGRERDILTWAAHGKSNADIAAILSLSTHTIDFHMRNIFKKLQAPSRVVAVVKAVSLGLIAL